MICAPYSPKTEAVEIAADLGTRRQVWLHNQTFRLAWSQNYLQHIYDND